MKLGCCGFLALVLMLTAATLAAAGQIPPPQPPPSEPSSPSPPAALTVPNPLAGLHPAGPDLYQSPDGSDRFRIGSQYPVVSPPIVVPPVYVPGPYWPYYGYHPYWRPGDYVSYYPQPKPSVQYGGLVLETVPGAAQVFVDGYYMGLAEEFGLSGRPLIIAAGAHRIELRAPGYDPSMFSVRIDPDEILRYRGDMQLISTRPAVVIMPVPSTARTLYVIPKCYAGDKPPTGTLPPGCDRKNLQTQK